MTGGERADADTNDAAAAVLPPPHEVGLVLVSRVRRGIEGVGVAQAAQAVLGPRHRLFAVWSDAGLRLAQGVGEEY